MLYQFLLFGIGSVETIIIGRCFITPTGKNMGRIINALSGIILSDESDIYELANIFCYNWPK